MATGYPDWHRGSLMQGLRNGVPTGVNMDELGNLVALLKGVYGTTPTTLTCDANGNLKVDLNIISAASLPTYFKPGVPVMYSGSGNLSANTGQYIKLIEGAVVVQSGYLQLSSTGVLNTDTLSIRIDGGYALVHQFTDYFSGANLQKEDSIVKCIFYDPINFKYVWNFKGPFYCASSFGVHWIEAQGRTPAWACKIQYYTI